MEKMLKLSGQDELRQESDDPCDATGGGVESDGRSASFRAGRQPEGPQERPYLRRLLTSLGQIDVMVPRSREGGSPADVMGRYRRRSEEWTR